MEVSDKEDLSSVLASIRRMVQKETRAQVSGSDTKPTPPKKPKVKPSPKPTGTAVAKVMILHPYMRVDIPKEKPEVLKDGADIPYDMPLPANDSFAIATPEVDEFMLRDMVREVVQQELRGDLGREIIKAMKKEVLLTLEDKT